MVISLSVTFYSSMVQEAIIACTNETSEVYDF